MHHRIHVSSSTVEHICIVAHRLFFCKFCTLEHHSIQVLVCKEFRSNTEAHNDIFVLGSTVEHTGRIFLCKEFALRCIVWSYKDMPRNARTCSNNRYKIALGIHSYRHRSYHSCYFHILPNCPNSFRCHS